MPTAADLLDSLTIKGELYEAKPNKDVRCFACGHRCLIRPGRRGICKVRFNRDGELFVPWGYVSGLQVDPIEKKPFYHVLSGSDALTFGMLGCDFHCDFCQNYLTSQFLRDPASDVAARLVRRISPEEVMSYAQQSGASVIASSYNEPLITTEWAVTVFKLAIKENIKTVFVSNGNATPEVLEYLRPYLAGFKVDLKTMDDRKYRRLGGVLQIVLDSIRKAYESGMWVEIVTLVIPGFNDSTEELMETARFISSLSGNIPWHVTAYHPDYHYAESPPTPAGTLIRAAEIGQEAGLNFVYAGNLTGRVSNYENTYCPQCRTLLVERYGYSIQKYNITSSGACPNCNAAIPGIWAGQSSVNKHTL
jgi:pyruvate formate lyase activating enzyme